MATPTQSSPVQPLTLFRRGWLDFSFGRTPSKPSAERQAGQLWARESFESGTPSLYESRQAMAAHVGSLGDQHLEMGLECLAAQAAGVLS